MKHDWKYIKLGDIISPAKVVRNGANKKFPVLSITMRDGIVLQSSRFKKSIASVDTSDYKVVYNGQLVIAFPIDEGLIYTQDIVDAGIMSPAYNVWNVDFLEIDRKFLVLYLHCPFSMAYYKSKLRGTTMRRRSMPKEDLLNMPLPVPSFSVQQSIISELDKINELIRLKKEQLKDYDNLAQSIFYEMFGDPVVNEKGWDIESLGKVCDVRDGTHDSPQYLQESPYILITSKNLVNGKIDNSNVNYISEEDYIAINKRSQVDDGDIIMAMIGTIGNPIIVKLEEHKFCIKNVALIKFFNDSLVSNKYVHSLLNNESYLTFIKSQNKGGTQKFVALGTIRKLPIPIPPLSYQQQYAQRIELIEQQKAEVQRTIKDLETLLASRMQYWFD